MMCNLIPYTERQLCCNPAESAQYQYLLSQHNSGTAATKNVKEMHSWAMGSKPASALSEYMHFYCPEEINMLHGHIS